MTGFVPINIPNKVVTPDTGYTRSNVLAPKPQSNNTGNSSGSYIPNNMELGSLVKNALDMQKHGVFADRGSILNILV